MIAPRALTKNIQNILNVPLFQSITIAIQNTRKSVNHMETHIHTTTTNTNGVGFIFVSPLENLGNMIRIMMNVTIFDRVATDMPIHPDRDWET